MSSPVTLLIIPFLIVYIQCATIPLNGSPGGEARLEDWSPRYYLADKPNWIVGANLKRNMKKCEQCRLSPMCRARDDCGHCDRYCEPHGVESERNGETASTEEVGIAREPENDLTQREIIKDMTLVSRSVGNKGMSEQEVGNEKLDQEEPFPRLQIFGEAVDGEQKEDAIVGNQRKSEEDINNVKPEFSRYYTVGVISPGLLMNIMLRLLNVKQTSEMEQTIVLVKSRKPVAFAVGSGGEIDVEFLRMLGNELETAETIHGNNLLRAKDINKILKTAYEKAELKLKSEAQIIRQTAAKETTSRRTTISFNESESNYSTMRQNEKDSSAALAEEMPQENDPIEGVFNSGIDDDTEESDLDIPSEENENSRTLHHKKYKLKKKKKGQMYSYSAHQGSYQNQQYGYGRSNIGKHPVLNQEIEEPLIGSHQNSLNGKKTVNGQESISNSVMEEKVQAQNTRNDNDSFGKYTVSYDDIIRANGNQVKSSSVEKLSVNDVTSKLITEDIIGSQQGSSRPLNEDLIGFKDDFQTDQKGINYKGVGGLLKVSTDTQKLRNNGAQFESELQITLPHIYGSKINEDFVRGDSVKESMTDISTDDNEGIAQIVLTDKNKELDPKKVSLARPNEDNHDGMPKAFHNRIHAHFNKVQDYYNKEPGELSENSKTIVGTIESTNHKNSKDNEISSDSRMNTRNNEEINNEENVDKSKIEDEDLDDMPKVGMNFQREDLKNADIMEYNDENMRIDETSKVGASIEHLNIPQEKKEKIQTSIKHTQTSNSRASGNIEDEFPLPESKDQALNDNEINNNIKEFGKQFNGPLFTNNDENLPGQKIIQLDDQLIDVPNEESSNSQPLALPASRISDNAQEPIDISTKQHLMSIDNENVREINIFNTERTNPEIMTDPTAQYLKSSEENENVSPSPAFALKNEKKSRYSKGTLLSNADGDEFSKMATLKDYAPAGASLESHSSDIIPDVQERFASSNKQNIISEGHELPTSNIPIKDPFSTIPVGSQSARDEQDSKIFSVKVNGYTSEKHPEFPTPHRIEINRNSAARIFASSQTQDMANSVKESFDHISTSTKQRIDIPQPSLTETVGKNRQEFENTIEEKIEKLISPKEQEFLHNFGKIVPSLDRMNLNSASDIYFMGNGIKLPLKMSPNDDGSISLSVDLEKLCKCKNSTCANKMKMMNKLDENLIEISNDSQKSEIFVPETEKNEKYNNIPPIAYTTDKKVRKPRHHMDLSKLYKTYRRKYHRLHKRSSPNEYMKRFKEIEQSLQNKLDDLKKNVKKSNEECTNMLRKGTKDLLQIKEEDPVVRHRIELVKDLLQWMKEMASGDTNVA